MVFAGGTFSTGAATGFSDTVGTMMLNASTASTLALGSGNHTLTFANSSALNWGAGGTLTITGWAGTGKTVVALHRGSVELLLGWTYVELGPLRLSTPSYFALVPERPLTHRVLPPRPRRAT